MIVECPLCDAEFDAQEAAARTDCACPHCDAAWTDYYDDENDPENVTIQYNHDGSSEVVAE